MSDDELHCTFSLNYLVVLRSGLKISHSELDGKLPIDRQSRKFHLIQMIIIVSHSVNALATNTPAHKANINRCIVVLVCLGEYSLNARIALL